MNSVCCEISAIWHQYGSNVFVQKTTPVQGAIRRENGGIVTAERIIPEANAICVTMEAP